MKKEKWSDFDSFVVMADKAKCYVKSDYPSFLDFKVLKSVMENVSKGNDPTNYYHDGMTLNLGVTRSVVLKALDKFYNNVWDSNINPMISRLGLRNLKAR